MLRIRRPEDELRIEIMPLIDVIFLLLTFFIYAMVLMIRAELLPVELQRFEAGTPASPEPAAIIAILLDGSIQVNREPAVLDDVLDRIRAAQAEDPDTVIYLALAAGDSAVDRGPILTALWDRLSLAGLEINLVGRPKDELGP
ncbi:MAG: ExbD/TolR family protein [Planctomycetota bacterium]|jgi:biopolymer transport protein ExbD